MSQSSSEHTSQLPHADDTDNQLKKIQLNFYTSLGCHLCDQATAIIAATLNSDWVEITPIEIADSDTLIELYGTRIPVLALAAAGLEIHNAEQVGLEWHLGWPFDQEQLIKFVSSCFER